MINRGLIAMGVGLGADGVGMLRLSAPGERAELGFDPVGPLGMVISGGCRLFVGGLSDSKAKSSGS
jgi:hypothetical protein